MGQQAYGAVRPTAEPIFHEIRYGLRQRNLRIAEVIPAPETGNVEPFVGPERMFVKQGRQFGQIQKHEKQAILKPVGPRPEAPVPDRPFVYAAVHNLFFFCYEDHIALSHLSAQSQVCSRMAQ
jgi:hypothetical protein